MFLEGNVCLCTYSRLLQSTQNINPNAKVTIVHFALKSKHSLHTQILMRFDHICGSEMYLVSIRLMGRFLLGKSKPKIEKKGSLKQCKVFVYFTINSTMHYFKAKQHCFNSSGVPPHARCQHMEVS